MTTPTFFSARTGEAISVCDVAIIGGGIAGLSVALSLPVTLRVALMTKGALGESNTRYAQGGLAAAVGLDDEPELHLRDTLAAGAGLVDEAAARVLVTEAREAVAWLIAKGTEFDQRAGATGWSPALPGDGVETLAEQYALGHEAAHSRRRVLHAHGDATGAEIERALVAELMARPNTAILDSALALELLIEDGACVGVEVLRQGQRVAMRAARGVVLANGGAGQLWLRTSNPQGATADGLALAWRAGAMLADVEFAQFHPTVLVPPEGAAPVTWSSPPTPLLRRGEGSAEGEAFLISEAVRGEGAYLRNAAGERFMPRYAEEAELAPRDVVARAILSEMLATGAPSVFLDLRHLPADVMRGRFPTIATTCRRYGLDLACDLIPVAPAAHYFMGGVAVDTQARTTVPRLYAVGEVACTGVHGANRLASNSLLEGLVFGRRAARAIAGEGAEAWLAAPPLPGDVVAVDIPLTAGTVATQEAAGDVRTRLRWVMWEHVSLRRDAAGLARAQVVLRDLALAAGPVDAETANMLFAAQVITAAALARTESRGGHYRVDYPERDVARDGRHTLLQATGMQGATVARGAEVLRC